MLFLVRIETEVRVQPACGDAGAVIKGGVHLKIIPVALMLGEYIHLLCAVGIASLRGDSALTREVFHVIQ